MKKRLFIFMIVAALFVSCQPTIDTTPQNETTTTSSPTTPRKVDKDHIVVSCVANSECNYICVQHYNSSYNIYGSSDRFDYGTTLRMFESKVVQPGKYFIYSDPNTFSSFRFSFDNIIFEKNKKYRIYRDHIEKTNQ